MKLLLIFTICVVAGLCPPLGLLLLWLYDL